MIPSMPKPDVVALTGGYRKTPVLQIGGRHLPRHRVDRRRVEQLQPEFTPRTGGMARTLAHWVTTRCSGSPWPTTCSPLALCAQPACHPRRPKLCQHRKAMSLACVCVRRTALPGLPVLACGACPTCWTHLFCWVTRPGNTWFRDVSPAVVILRHHARGGRYFDATPAKAGVGWTVRHGHGRRGKIYRRRTIAAAAAANACQPR
jgi:hypothetical protein